MIKDLLKALSWCVFTRRCDLCGDVVPLTQSRCDECLKAEKINGEICTSCGMSKNECTCKSSHHKPEYEQICAPFYYEGNIVKAMHRLKFQGFCENVIGMADEMAKTIKKQYNHINFDAITYVPLSKSRERARYIISQNSLPKDCQKLSMFRLKTHFIRRMKIRRNAISPHGKGVQMCSVRLM